MLFCPQAAASKSDDGPAALVDAGTRALLEWARTKGLKTSKIGPATFGVRLDSSPARPARRRVSKFLNRAPSTLRRTHVSSRSYRRSWVAQGLRGMVATEDVADGDIVAEVPYGAALEVVTSLRPCPFPEARALHALCSPAAAGRQDRAPPALFHQSCAPLPLPPIRVSTFSSWIPNSGTAPLTGPRWALSSFERNLLGWGVPHYVAPSAQSQPFAKQSVPFSHGCFLLVTVLCHSTHIQHHQHQ